MSCSCSASTPKPGLTRNTVISYTPNEQPMSAPKKNPTPLDPIRLPLAFHIPKSFVQYKGNKPLPMWLSCADTAILFYEINRIWKPVGIRFTFHGCYISSNKPTKQQEKALHVLEESNREMEEESPELNNRRKSAIKILSEQMPTNIPTAFNAHFVPYMGETRQGNAVGGHTTVCCGVWTDKPSRGVWPPQKTLLSEPHQFYEIGSLGRTLAHELGHCLGLQHNDNGFKSPNIMNNPDGYGFTREQIDTAIAYAKLRLKYLSQKQH